MASQKRLQVGPIQTGLFDQMAALQDEVYRFEEWIILEAVLDLFETGQTKFIETNQKNLADF